jgi:hypothetical protein
MLVEIYIYSCIGVKKNGGDEDGNQQQEDWREGCVLI